MKKAFTLVEVMVSIVLLGIMFTYIYGTINSVKKQNNHYIEKSNKIKKEAKILYLINMDIAQAIGTISVTNREKYDVVQFKTKNSIYDIIEPNVIYLVSKKDNALIRIESVNSLNFDNKDQLTRTFLYADVLMENTISFKALYESRFVTILLRGENIKPIVYKIPTVSR